MHEELVETISLKNNHYEVQLPWKSSHPLLPDNYRLSQKRLHGLLKRLRQDPEILREYDSVIKEQIKKGIVELVEEPTQGEVGKVHYIPHRAIIRRDKSTTKLRVVYDASARSSGPSLNDCLHTGPTLTQNILDIILRFRTNKVALTGDIEKAFLMVSMAGQDRDVLRFLWVDDIEKISPEIVTLRFTRVVFGVSSSLFLLNATIRHHIEQYKEEDPGFVERFLLSIYVDDLSSGGGSEDVAYELYVKSKLRLAEGGFNLRKFVTNSTRLREKSQQNEAASCTPDQTSTQKGAEHVNSSGNTQEDVVREEDKTYAKSLLGATEESPKEEQKVLGVRWNYIKDELVFDLMDIAHLARNSEPTRRNVISIAARFYDPLGFISPIVVQFKMLFQDLCKSKLDWNDQLEGELKARWQKLVTGLQKISAITLPRCYFSQIDEPIISCKLHGFCDASSKAYAAVVYLYITTASRSYIRFLASKTRVAPVAQQTIPRLELLSALILSRLVTNVAKALEAEVNISKITCWSDSEVALFWIRGQSKEWKPFVQNRVDEIRDIVPISAWKHCPGGINPADIPSRGMSPEELSENTLWREGPTCLVDTEETTNERGHEDEHTPEECWVEMKAKDRQKMKAATASTLLVKSEPSGIARIMKCEDYSELQRLLRVTAYVLRFASTLLSKVRRDNQMPNKELTSRDLAEAETHWIKEIQMSVRKNQRFKEWRQQLGLFTDDMGVIRCKGRLENADLPTSTKYPILLEANHPITSLIVKDGHR